MGLPGIRGLQTAETLRTKAKHFTDTESRGDVLGARGRAAAGRGSLRLPPDKWKKENFAFPCGPAARAAPVVTGSPAGTASSDRRTPQMRHRGPEKGSSRWGH